MRTLLTLLACALLGLAAPAFAQDKLVLLVNAHSPLTTLNSLELHKVFLGLSVTVDNQHVRAVRNDADELMHQVFFQNIVSMSESVYDRRMLAMTLQQGGAPPLVMRSTKEVLNALAADTETVSFAWAAEAAKDPRVKVLRVLWHP